MRINVKIRTTIFTELFKGKPLLRDLQLKLGALYDDHENTEPQYWASTDRRNHYVMDDVYRWLKDATGVMNKPFAHGR